MYINITIPNRTNKNSKKKKIAKHKQQIIVTKITKRTGKKQTHKNKKKSWTQLNKQTKVKQTNKTRAIKNENI